MKRFIDRIEVHDPDLTMDIIKGLESHPSITYEVCINEGSDLKNRADYLALLTIYRVEVPS